MWDVPLSVLESPDPDQVLRITLEGELDLSVCDQLGIRLQQLRLGGTPVRLDMSRVDFIDSSAVHMLVRAMREAENDGERQLEIVPEVKTCVRRVIEMTAIGPILWPRDERVVSPRT